MAKGERYLDILILAYRRSRFNPRERWCKKSGRLVWIFSNGLLKIHTRYIVQTVTTYSSDSNDNLENVSFPENITNRQQMILFK